MGHSLLSSILRFFGFRPNDSRTGASRRPGGSASARQASAQSISYDPNLIPRLKAEHLALFHLFGEIQAASEQGDFLALPGMVAKLRLGLQRHLMVENVRLYVYLLQRLSRNPRQATFVNNAKNEMDRIARSVVRFAETYSTTAAIAANADAFKRGLQAMGEVLTKRVTLEETELYALYSRSL